MFLVLHPWDLNSMMKYHEFSEFLRDPTKFPFRLEKPSPVMVKSLFTFLFCTNIFTLFQQDFQLLHVYSKLINILNIEMILMQTWIISNTTFWWQFIPIVLIWSPNLIFFLTKLTFGFKTVIFWFEIFNRLFVTD